MDSIMMPAMPIARVNGISINYQVAGRGPWLTLSHSLACRLEMWDEEVRRLSERFTVLAFDARGHGRSSAPPVDYTLDMIADDIVGLLDHVGAEKTHWVGLSMGGIFGLTTALKYPKRFSSLVLADTGSKLSDESVQAFKDRVATVRAGRMEAIVQPTLKRWFTDAVRERRTELMARVAEWIRNTPLEGYAGVSAAIPTIDVTHRLHEIDIPVLVIVGADDRAMPLALSQTLVKNLPDAELVVIADAGHLSNLEQPDRFYEALERFYNRIA